MSNPVNEPVHFKKEGEVAVLTMQWAPHNLLGKVLSEALVASVKQAEAEKARAIVIKSGLRHFSAGADLVLFDNHGARLHADLDAVGLLRAFEELSIPIVASVHGIAIGGGFEIALAADLIVAASSAKLGLVEVSMGELADLLAMDRSTLGRNLKPLEREKFLRISVGEDRRARIVTTTASGRKRLQMAYPLWKAVQARFERKVGKREAKKLLEITRSLVLVDHFLSAELEGMA
jgi:DNA-binding MarR family transcriptional regulator